MSTLHLRVYSEDSEVLAHTAYKLGQFALNTTDRWTEKGVYVEFENEEHHDELKEEK